MGQSLSRLADWQTDMLADVLDPGRRTRTRAPRRRSAQAVEAARALLPQLQPGAGLRLAPAPRGQRRPAAAPPPAPGDRRELAVGFADLVGYTSRSRGMGGRELGAMVEDFESTAAEVIARHRGRVVKTVGDGVLFTAGTAVDAVEIGLDAARRLGRRGPAAAAGRAPPTGAVLTRLGDVYSPVVNLASRLTSIARPGTVLVDRELAQSAARAAGVPGAAAAPGLGARLRPPAAVAGAAPPDDRRRSRRGLARRVRRRRPSRSEDDARSAGTDPFALRARAWHSCAVVSATLVARGLAAGHGARVLFSDLDLVVAPGDVVGLVGVNGAGKSTLLRTLAGELPAEDGVVAVSPPSATLGYLPQEHERRPGETVLAALARRTGVAAAQAALDARDRGA